MSELYIQIRLHIDAVSRPELVGSVRCVDLEVARCKRRQAIQLAVGSGIGLNRWLLVGIDDRNRLSRAGIAKTEGCIQSIKALDLRSGVAAGS